MIGDTLTKENLSTIKTAMDNIEENDRSNFFNQYYNEVVERIDLELQREKVINENIDGDYSNGFIIGQPSIGHSKF